MSKLTSKDATTITYDKHGSGPVLILILGALNKRGSGKKLTEALAGEFTVVSYDRRGRGDSGDSLPYSVDKEVDDIEAIIDGLGGKAYLYGHSSGGILALSAAEKLSTKVAGLAVYEVPYDDEAPAQKRASEYQQTLRQLLEKDDRAGAVSLFVKSVGVSDKQIAAMQNLPMWKGLTGMAPTLAYDTIELMQHYPQIALNQIQTPTLVMYGGASPEFMGRTATHLSNELPQAQLQSLADQTHDVKPAALAPVLLAFLKSG
jgi:pimeloyl-ACP methyl ester carboxylesterase